MKSLRRSALSAQGMRSEQGNAVGSAAEAAEPAYIIDRTVKTEFAYFVNARLCLDCPPLHIRAEWKITSGIADGQSKASAGNEAKGNQQTHSRFFRTVSVPLLYMVK